MNAGLLRRLLPNRSFKACPAVYEQLVIRMKMIKLMKRLCIFVPLLALTQPLSAAPEYGKLYETQIQKDIVYRSAQQLRNNNAETINLKLDLYQPIGVNGKSPLIIFIHGGSFTQGSKEAAYAVEISSKLAQRGAVVANINYRLEQKSALKYVKGRWVRTDDVTPIHNDQRFTELVKLAQQANELGYFEYPNGVISALEDTLYAYDFLLENASVYKIDAQRIGVWGVSAGAVTASHFAYILDDFMVATPDIKTVTMLSGYNGISEFTGNNYVQAGEASVFQFNGAKDATTPLFPYGYNMHLYANAVVDAAHIYIGEGIGHATQDHMYTTMTSNGKSVFENAVEFNANALYFPGLNQGSLCEVVNSALGSDCSQYPEIQ